MTASSRCQSLGLAPDLQTVSGLGLETGWYPLCNPALERTVREASSVVPGLTSWHLPPRVQAAVGHSVRGHLVQAWGPLGAGSGRKEGFGVNGRPADPRQEDGSLSQTSPKKQPATPGFVEHR